MLHRIIGFLLLTIYFTVPAMAQKPTVSKTDLQAKRAQLLQEIKDAQDLLNETKKSQTVTLTELRALNKKLELRQRLINNINLELKGIASDITTTSNDITELNKQLAKFRAEYARSVRYAYKQKESQNMMAFVFSANTFNDMMRRMEYMKKYRQYRTVQANRIRQIQGSLKQKVGFLNNIKVQRSDLLQSEQQHKSAIEADANETEKVAQELKGQVSDLSSKIAKNKKAAAQLDNEIRIQIQKEIAEARRKAAEEARLKAIAEAKQRAEEEARRKAEEFKRNAEEAQRTADINRQKAAEAEQKRAADLARQADLARKKAAEDAERQRLKDIEDAKKRREEAALEEKRIADAAAREKQRIRNEERNKEIDRRKEEMRQQELARQRKIAADLDIEKQKAQQQSNQYKSGNAVVTLNTGSSSHRPNTTVATVPSTPARTENTAYKNILAPEVQTLSNSFASNKGGLPWPVDRGVIVAPYGNYPHPLEKSVMLNNSGIDIGTSAGAPVKAVFSGVVTKIFSVPGMGVTVLVSHGQYYTVYSKLSSASVGVGAKVATRQTLGVAGKNDDGDNVVHFEVWKVGDNGAISNMNPTGWIAPR